MDFTLNDLSNVVRVIDIATERGAFKGPELSSVGGLRDKIVATLDAASKAAQEQEGEAEAEPQEASED